MSDDAGRSRNVSGPRCHFRRGATSGRRAAGYRVQVANKLYPLYPAESMESKSIQSLGVVPGTLIFGAGYVGGRVAQWVRERYRNEPVYPVTRSPKTASRWASEGFLPVVADWTDSRTLQALPRCTRVLVAVAHDPKSGKSREDSQVGGLRRLLAHVDPESDLVYLSTTGVYHQTDGGWVDETSPARPIGAGGKAHLRAEECLARQRPNGRWVILRLAGIYGPNRVPRVNDIRAGRPLDGPQLGYLNLIHRDDATAAILAAWERPDRKHRVYLVSDDRPVPRRQFYEEIARRLGRPAPTFLADAPTHLSARSHSNKRVWNRRLRRELLPRLLYPDYLAGLTDCLQ